VGREKPILPGNWRIQPGGPSLCTPRGAPRPGLGEVRWDRFIAALYAVGYDFVLSIEHEDRRFEGHEELVERGFLIARNNLRPHIA
jgi:sugar phosphate isomerase/epimerase